MQRAETLEEQTKTKIEAEMLDQQEQGFIF